MRIERDLPIIATTAYTTEDKRRQCREAGMSAFLIKPISLEKIHAALSTATAALRPAASFHPPRQEQPADPLSSLRLLASRKGFAVEKEIDLYFTELAGEERLLVEALRRRVPGLGQHGPPDGRRIAIAVQREVPRPKPIVVEVLDDDAVERFVAEGFGPERREHVDAMRAQAAA